MRFRRFLTPRIIACAIAALVVLVVFGGTFVAPDSGLLPPPSAASDTTPKTTTTTIDFSAIALPEVAGEERPVPLVERGKASVVGTVEGPDGLIPGATVRLERLVGDQVQRFDVATGADGIFRAEGVPGGRYRVRAWLVPNFTVAVPEVFFLVDGEEHQSALRVDQLNEVVVTASVRPEAPILGQGVNIAVLVSDRVVDADGVARTAGRSGVPVSLSVAGMGAVDATAVRATDGSGVAVFEFSCEAVGSVSATALVGEAALPTATTTTTTTAPTTTQPGTPPPTPPNVIDEVVTLEVPPCAPIPTTTTTTSTVPGDGGEEPTTTTQG